MRHRLETWCFAVLLVLAPCAGSAQQGAESKDVPEWVELQNRLQVLKARVTGKEKIVHGLIEAKRTEKDPAQLVRIVEDLKREHKELTVLIEDYEKARNVLQYRYPERGLKEGRVYHRIESQTLNEMEERVGLDGVLQKTMGKVRRQYPDPDRRLEGKSAPGKVETGTPRVSPVMEPAVMSK